jgi:hypothetical protein
MSSTRLTVPRFFFHVEGSPDNLGLELPSIAQAKCEAARYAGHLLCDAADSFWATAEFNMQVANETGLVLFTITISGTDAPVIRHEPVIEIKPA